MNNSSIDAAGEHTARDICWIRSHGLILYRLDFQTKQLGDGFGYFLSSPRKLKKICSLAQFDS